MNIQYNYTNVLLNRSFIAPLYSHYMLFWWVDFEYTQSQPLVIAKKKTQKNYKYQTKQRTLHTSF